MFSLSQRFCLYLSRYCAFSSSSSTTNSSSIRPTASQQQSIITSHRIWKPTIPTNRHLLPQNRLLPQNTHHEHYKSNTNLNILTFESFDILMLQSPSPKTQNSDHLNIIHTKKLREKRKSIPDSCCHLHLLHLLRQDSFLFALFLFPFHSFVFSTLFCFVCLCLTKPVKLLNSSLYAFATSIKCLLRVLALFILSFILFHI